MFKPSSKYKKTDSSKALLLCQIFCYLCSMLISHSVVSVSFQPCGHLLGKGWPLLCDVFLCFCHFLICCVRSGETVSIPDLCLLPYFDNNDRVFRR